MVKGRQKIRIPNPHGKGDIDVGLLKEILRQAGIKNEEWDKAWILPEIDKIYQPFVLRISKAGYWLYRKFLWKKTQRTRWI